ncbi:hydrolase, partial [Streptomyces sp. SID11233]|nr:hydrolase [Streptomyces sp. SID11233]
MSEMDPQIAAEYAELAALEEASAGGEPLPEGEYLPPPPGGWFPCPCCGHQTFGAQGEYEICEVCAWEDDISQLRDPWSGFGANHFSLVEAQENY